MNYIYFKNLNLNIYESGDYLTKIDLFGNSIIFFLGQYLKTLALQITNNVNIIVLRYLDTIFTIALDIVLLHSKLHLNQIIGIFLILFGCIINYIF